ncbi:molecular chaperone DnaK, partial [Candidatus Sumerlaeota bacterium]|nr:molecular chaperone DnaK [Candidatus Sumerlaeota bacterium]
MMQEKKIIGIDFGTTFSLAAYLEADVPVIIPNQEGQNKTPSVVAFTEDEKVLVGEIARRQAGANPQHTIHTIKRYLGRDFFDIEEREEKVNFIAKDRNGKLSIKIFDRELTPEEIASFIFSKLKDASEHYLGEEVKYVVITVPAYFDDLQREAVSNAAKLAGLEVVRLINEPTAAAMAYGLHKKRNQTIAVYDFGGGTFDISILQIEENTFEVLSTKGDTYLGGENIDSDLAELLAREFLEKHHIDLTKDHSIFLRLKESAEIAKCELSTREFTIITLPFIAHSEGGALHFERKIQRAELERIVQPYIERTLECCQEALQDAALSTKDINEVILVGGSSRIPAVRKAVAEFFGKQPSIGLNPDEIVAMGAAIQGGVLEGKLQEVVLLDVTPHALGIETEDNVFTKIIEKNSTIPIKASKIFTTTSDNQRFVNIHILQGESDLASENRSLGKFTLTDIPPAPAGVPRIRVTFFINSNGILEVSAVETSTGIENKLSLFHSFLDTQKRKERHLSRIKSAETRRPVRKSLAEEKKTAELQVSEALPEKDSVHPVEEVARIPDASYNSSAYTFIDTEETSLDIKPDIVIEDSPNHQTRIMHQPPSVFSAEGQALLEKYNITLSPELQDAIKRFSRGDVSSTAIHRYGQAIEELEKLLEKHDEVLDFYYLLIKMYLLTGGEKKALEAIKRLKEKKTLPQETMRHLYDTIVRSFPMSEEARKNRLFFYLEQGDYENAIGDLEVLYEKEKETAWLEKIAEAYEHILKKKDNPSIKFRLVKTYVKLHQLDKAINLLQELVEDEEYRLRALKILGLCLWQKKLFVKAWQKLKLLPLDDEVADMIYRLGKDMEEAEQLKSASNVYQRLKEYDPNYRDINLRIKKINYRLKLQEKDRFPMLYGLKEPRFVIIEEINRGSMGIIYKARDIALDEIVVLKVLNELLLSDESAVKRFKQEAKAAKKLSHPHIVRIHDFYDSGDKKFIS